MKEDYYINGMALTPKKIIIDVNECFLCKTVVTKEGINVFGRSSLNLVELIRRAVNVNLEEFAQTRRDVHVCRKCYKQLSRLDRLINSTTTICKELRDLFQKKGSIRVKRMATESPAQAARLQPKTLLFSAPSGSNGDSIPFPQSAESQIFPSPCPISTGYTAGFLPPNTGKACHLVTKEFQPLQNSTPLKAQQMQKTAVQESGSIVKITVEYPSKTVRKELSKELAPLGKAIAFGDEKRIARSVMKNTQLNKCVVNLMLKKLGEELNGLCSRKIPSLLRKNTKDDMVNFSLERVCMELKEKTPLFYAVLMSCANARDYAWLPSVAVAASVLTKQRNSHMNTLATVIGFTIKNRSTEAILDRLSKLKITASNRCILKRMSSLGENHDIILNEMKNSISQGQAEPGYNISYDNIDIRRERSHMSMKDQNLDIHWVNHRVTVNRVAGNSLSTQLGCGVLNVSNLSLFPSIQDQKILRQNLIVLVSRILVKHFTALNFLQDVCVWHISHKYTKDMAKKSVQVPLGVLFNNENINDEMVCILKKFQEYLPHTLHKNNEKFDPQLFSGDQLSVERAINVIQSVSNGYTEKDRLEGMIFQMGDWHACVKVLEVLFRRFYSGSSASDNCTLMADRNLINRRNVRDDPHSAYKPDRDFVVTEVHARVVAAAMKVLGIETQSSAPVNFPIPDKIDEQNSLTKLRFLHKAAAKVVDEVIIDHVSFASLMEIVTAVQEEQDFSDNQKVNADGRFPCRYPECPKSFKYDGKARKKHEATHDPPVVVSIQEGDTSNAETTHSKQEEQDDVYNYNCALLSEGLLFMNFLDAIAEGDGGRILRQYKYLVLLFMSDAPHSNKYALESLYQLLLVNSILSKRDAHRYIWNRSVNNNGGLGRNIPLDLAVEHSNNFLKQAINHLGVNLTENAVTRISKAEAPMRSVMDNIDKDVNRMARSGKHKKKSSDTDMDVLVRKLREEDVFTSTAGRSYNHFKNFERNTISWLNISHLYKWINKHKKNMSLGIRAR